MIMIIRVGRAASGLKRSAAMTGGAHEMNGPKNGIAYRIPDEVAVTGM
jgi:hypothetical protein